MKTKRFKNITAIILAMLLTLSAGNVWALDGYSTPQETWAPLASLPDNTARGQLSASVKGNTVINMLGNAGDCESLSPFRSYTTATLSLDTNYRYFGANSMKTVASTANTEHYVQANFIANANTKYFLSAYITPTVGRAALKGFAQNDQGQYVYAVASNYVTEGTSKRVGCILNVNGATTGIDAIIRVHLYNNSINGTVFTGSGETTYIDGLMVVPMTSADEGLTPDQLLEKYPYVNGSPSVNPVKITSTGKNLIPRATISNDNVISSGDGSYTVKTTGSVYGATASDKIRVKPGETYTLSAKKTNTAAGARVALLQCAKDGSVIGSWDYFTLIDFTTGYVTKTIDAGVDHLKLRFISDTSNGSITAGQETSIYDIQLEKGTAATAYEPYEETAAYTARELRSVPGGTADEINLNTGAYTKKVSDWMTLDGTQDYELHYNGTGFKAIRFSTPNAVSSMVNINPQAQVLIKYNGKLLERYTSAATDGRGDVSGLFNLSGTMKCSLFISNTDSGWIDGASPTTDEIKAFIYGWKMCAADGSAYVSGTKYWKKITDGTGLTAAIPTASYTGYTPYRLIYQLAKPEVYKVSTQPLAAFRSGSIMSDRAVKAVGTYGTKLTIANSNLPIQSVESVNRLDGNIITPIDPATVTIAADGKSFTILNAKKGEAYEYTYRYRDELGTRPVIKYSVPVDTTGQINGNTDMLKSYNDLAASLISRLDKLEALINVQTKVAAAPIQVNLAANQSFNVALTASGAQDISRCTFTVIYDPSRVQVTDLCTATAAKELTEGAISGTNITITKNDTSSGIITFEINGASYSGAVNNIEFKALVDGQTTITYTVE